MGSGGSSKSSSSPTDRMSSSFLIPLSCHHGQFSLARNANMTKVLRPACLLRVSRPKNSNYLYSSFVIQFSITTQSFHFMSRNFRQEVSRVPGSEYGGSCGRKDEFTFAPSSSSPSLTARSSGAALFAKVARVAKGDRPTRALGAGGLGVDTREFL